MTSADELDRLLAVAKDAAAAATALLGGVRPHEIRGKGNPRDLVTEWDLRRGADPRRARADAPDIPILGEEEGGAGAGAPPALARRSDRRHRELRARPADLVVSIALEDDGRAGGRRRRRAGARLVVRGECAAAARSTATGAPAAAVSAHAPRSIRRCSSTGFPVRPRDHARQQLRRSGSTSSAVPARAGGSAARRSIFAWSRAAGSMATGSASSSRGTSRPAR